MQKRQDLREQVPEVTPVWTSIRNFFQGKKEDFINDFSLVIDIDLLESRLSEIPLQLENLIQNQRVFQEQEFKDFLSEKFEISNPDRKMIMHFLRKFNFVRRVKRHKRIFYIVGEKRDQKVENFEVDQKLLALGLAKMIQKEQTLKEEFKNLYKKAKTIKEKNRIKSIKIECIAKAKILNRLKGKITMIRNQIDLAQTAQDDVNMKNLIQETQIDPTILEDAVDTIQQGVTIQQEIRDQQQILGQVINQSNEDQEDILAMFNDLDGEGNITEDFEKNYKDSVMKLEVSARKKVEQSPEFVNKSELKQDLYSEPSTVKKDKGILGIEDVKQFHQEKYGKLEENGEKQVLTSKNKLLIFNNKKNGLKEIPREGVTFAEFKKQSTIREKVNQK